MTRNKNPKYSKPADKAHHDRQPASPFQVPICVVGPRATRRVRVDLDMKVKTRVIVSGDRAQLRPSDHDHPSTEAGPRGLLVWPYGRSPRRRVDVRLPGVFTFLTKRAGYRYLLRATRLRLPNRGSQVLKCPEPYDTH